MANTSRPRMTATLSSQEDSMARITVGVGMVSDRKSILSRTIDEVRLHKTTRRKRYLLVACFAVVVTVGLTPAFQAGVPAGLESSHRKAGADVVGGYSFHWFVSDCRWWRKWRLRTGGTDLRTNRVAISLSGIGSSGWHIERITVDGLEGTLIAPERMTPPPSPLAHEPNSLLLHAAVVNNVDVEILSNQAALAVEWERLSLEELQWDGTRLNGAVHLLSRCNSASTVDGPWSVAGSHCFFQGLGTALQPPIPCSNSRCRPPPIGERFPWTGRPTASNKQLPSKRCCRCVAVRSDHWLREWSQVNRLGHFRTIHLAHGVRRHWRPPHLDVEVPLAYRSSSGTSAPLISAARRWKRFPDSPASRSLRISTHLTWQIQGEHDGTTTTARLTPRQRPTNASN